jgi:pyrimidine deaminase RibD-like protein
MQKSDLEFIRIAIEEARKSSPEDTRIHPLVGVVVVKEGKELARAHRGEFPGNHAEFIALEKKLGKEMLTGCTVYTTLEPCTTRNHPKVPCAARLAEHKVRRVVIGMLDPNRLIQGDGFALLRDANIVVDMFPSDEMAKVEELNREFTRWHRHPQSRARATSEFIQANKGRPLDEWYRVVNSVYWNRNFYRGAMSIFTHLVEVVGGLSLLASQKKKEGVTPARHIPKALAWWMALCGKLGIRSVEDMLWMKFPGVCPYCHRATHDQFECGKKKAARPGPDWEALAAIGEKGRDSRPKSLGDWQQMYLNIYQVSGTEDYGHSFARLAEELGELAEALRTFPAAPGYFVSEASDVFAWLMRVQNIVELKEGTEKDNIGRALELGFCESYPDLCVDCGLPTCNCAPILEGTVGRIAHEIPKIGGSFDVRSIFLTPERTLALFQLGKSR